MIGKRQNIIDNRIDYIGTKIMAVNVNCILHCVVAERVLDDFYAVSKDTIKKSVSDLRVFIEIYEFFDLNVKFYSYNTDSIRICAHFNQEVYNKVIYVFSFILLKTSDDLLYYMCAVRVA